MLQAIAIYHKNKIEFGPAKAANAGGVAVSGDAMILIMWQDDIIGAARLLTHASKGCAHQLALLWGTRHLISPELA